MADDHSSPPFPSSMMIGWTDRETDRQTNGQTAERTRMNGWTSVGENIAWRSRGEPRLPQLLPPAGPSRVSDTTASIPRTPRIKKKVSIYSLYLQPRSVVVCFLHPDFSRPSAFANFLCRGCHYRFSCFKPKTLFFCKRRRRLHRASSTLEKKYWPE